MQVGDLVKQKRRIGAAVQLVGCIVAIRWTGLDAKVFIFKSGKHKWVRMDNLLPLDKEIKQ
jgi:hypothetical protein